MFASVLANYFSDHIIDIGFKQYQKLRCDAEPVEVGGTSIVGGDVRPRAEKSQFRSDPFTFTRLELFAKGLERLAVDAVEETALDKQVMAALAFRNFGAVGGEGDA
jgi:hypothetical protein